MTQLPPTPVRTSALGAIVLVVLACTAELMSEPTIAPPELIVQLAPATMVLHPGEVAKVQVEVTSTLGARFQSTLEWRSSDTAVARVDDSGRLVATGLGSATITATPTKGRSGDLEVVVSPAPGPGTPILLAAGDIARCTETGQFATAALLDSLQGPIAALGDIAYPDGSPTDFAECFDPAWGRHRARIHPSPGNHEYHTPGASGYFDYFGAAAGDPAKGYYSFDVGAWHIVSLNSNLAGDAMTAQVAWLDADLAASGALCTVAYLHHPRFSSGKHGNDARTAAIWEVLHRRGVELLLVGHEHSYERFARQDPTGAADPARGIRQIIVGSGGTALRDFVWIVPNSELRDADHHGILSLELGGAGYRWAFVTAPGGVIADAGQDVCF